MVQDRDVPPSAVEGPYGQFSNLLGQQFQLIPAGTFLMGSSDEELRVPQHSVTISEAFLLGAFPVTQQQYQQVMGTNPSRFSDGPHYPVERVSWFDAIDFCNRLSDLDHGKARYYSRDGNDVTILGGPGYRLPTEAEWEYACRAGSDANYCFGGQPERLPDYAWFNVKSRKSTRPVGQKQPNAWGLYEMHGNVWEWCWDWYGDYPCELARDPMGPPQGSVRVYRGGSWFMTAKYCLSSIRGRNFPATLDDSLGFRVAAVPP